MVVAVKQVRALHRRILDNLSTTVLLFDGDLRLHYVNPAGEMQFAISARHLLGRSADALLPHSELNRALCAALRSGHPFTEREVQIALDGAHPVTMDVTVMVFAEHDTTRELLVELVQVDRQLRISRDEQLVAQQQATRELLRGLSHEVKNPLGGLRGAAQLLERELHDEQLREYTQVIISEADRLRALVDRMLGPNTLPRRRRINIHEVLERVRNLVKAEVAQGLHVYRDYDPSIPELEVAADQLVQVVLNIVRNAVQAINGCGTITLRTRVLRQHTIGQQQHRLVLRVEVIDDGPGIPADIKERIFYPLVTGRAQGSGLGLSIAQSLIQQHGGIVECASQPGRTVFSILLPLLGKTVSRGAT